MSPLLFTLAFEKDVRDISICQEMELKSNNVMLAYADNIVILGDAENNIVKTTEKLIESNHGMNLTINEEKTKYLIMSRLSVSKTTLKVGPYSFEQVDKFKYFGVNINTKKNNMHNEIHRE